jgi:3-oxoacyl-[acyl-carrier-protein] synthase-3
VDQLRYKLEGEKQLFLCGFGVGMSWATAVIPTKNIKISKLVEL